MYSASPMPFSGHGTLTELRMTISTKTKRRVLLTIRDRALHRMIREIQKDHRDKTLLLHIYVWTYREQTDHR